MENTLFVLLVVSVFLVLYSYALYPTLLLVGTRFIRRQTPPAPPSAFPSISVVVAAHNEERVIEEKIFNTFALEYPADRLELLVGSDGSTDSTDEICQRHSRVHFVRIEPRSGKANILNTLIPRARGEIILLSDANTTIEPGALTAMVRHFNDPTVGGVCGHLVLTSSRQRLEDTERTYWSYESKIKELESCWHSTVGANGGIYAIRRDLFVPIPVDTIIDDFLISLNLLEQRKRLVFEREAVAYEQVSKSFRDEFWRKVRIGAGNLQAMLRKGSFPFKVPPFVGFAFLSHKIIRWLIPFLLIVIWVCTLLLSDRQPFKGLFWIYNVTLLVAVAGMLGMSENRLVKAFSYLYALNLALLIGYGRYLLGIQRVTWRRGQR
jgi:biofilm PGA synthesis N-glycosyltransferase PgaC